MDLKDNSILFREVVKSYSGKTVLNHLSFEVKKNASVALIGNNGCGKTTTINVLCNLTTYEKGEVIIQGNKVTESYTSYKQNLGIVLSSPYYIEEFNITEYLSFVANFQSLKKKVAKEQISNLVKLFGLGNEQEKPIKSLSSGTRMKVSLASALVHNPPILIKIGRAHV